MKSKIFSTVRLSGSGHELQKSDSYIVSKTLKTILAIVALATTIFSCSKSDDATAVVVPPVVAAPEQDPLAGYLIASGFNQETSSFVDAIVTESGFSFIPLVNGKITAIVVKIPDVQTGLRVTIWDKNSKTVIRTESIDVRTAATETIKQITAIDLIKEKEYFITMNSADRYVHEKTSGNAAAYPFIVEDIKITSYGGSVGTTQIYPTVFNTAVYSGDCSFKFQK